MRLGSQNSSGRACDGEKMGPAFQALVEVPLIPWSSRAYTGAANGGCIIPALNTIVSDSIKAVETRRTLKLPKDYRWVRIASDAPALDVRQTLE
jgi:hypothetical protein